MFAAMDDSNVFNVSKELSMRSISPIRILPALFVACLAITLPCSAAFAQTMDHGTMTAGPTAPPSVGQMLFDKIHGLIGTWDAPLGNDVITDIFQPFAFDTAILGEEWLNGKQITSTVFYVVNGELHADHYCDFLNQPRYTAVPSMDPDVIDFQFRDATNLDAHPKHFHGTKWKIVDTTHLIQDWIVMGGKKPVSLAHMEFVKHPEGAPVPPPANAAPKS
jgi:hypothetical protein